MEDVIERTEFNYYQTLDPLTWSQVLINLLVQLSPINLTSVHSVFIASSCAVCPIMDVKSVFSVRVLVFIAIGIAALTVPVPASFDGLLTLDVVRDDRIVGDFYPQEKVPEWYIKFSVTVEDKEIVSKSKLVLVYENHTVPFTELKIPLKRQYHRIIPNMSVMVLQAAKDAFTTYTTHQLPDIRELVDAYDNLANAVNQRFPPSFFEVNQFTSSIMYHSAIVGSVWRLTEGTTEDSKICNNMLLTSSQEIQYFVCAQDIRRITTKLETVMEENEINTFDEKLSKRAAEDDTTSSGSGLPSTEKPTTGISKECRITFMLRLKKIIYLRVCFYVRIEGN